jgi:hypothetical protein
MSNDDNEFKAAPIDPFKRYNKINNENDHFGGSTFEKMSRGVTGMFNSMKSKNQTAAEELIKREYKSAGMGDDARKNNVLNLIKQRMDALDANNKSLAKKLQVDIESALSKDGLGQPMAPPTKKWWKTAPSDVEALVDAAFGRKRKLAHKKRSSFGRKRRSSYKKRRN